jgi:lipopolysaccharide transport system ATP-binding protein
MSARISAKDLTKIFALAEHGGGPVSLLEALRTGKRTVHTREVRALDVISFEIAEGERVGIIGPNGAGKTTLLSILAGLSEPTSGRVEVEGDVHAMLTVGAVLRDDLTGRENIYLDASVHGRKRGEIDAVASSIVEFAELGEFIERPVRTYSSGMKARLAFSMGAFINPDILIIDETLSVGDAFFAEKAKRRMREITANGRIVIMVTHGLASVVDMCTRCLWLDRGHVIMDGEPKTVTKAYETAVREADEKELTRKFACEEGAWRSGAPVAIDSVELVQRGQSRQASIAAMVPLTFVIKGRAIAASRSSDLTLGLIRVDGRRIFSGSLSQASHTLPERGPFIVRVEMEPFVLGADLYRLDVTVCDEAGACSAQSRVFEIVDEEGQYGGKPLIYYPPLVTAKPMGGKGT